MLLSYLELVELVNADVINAPLENVNGASIDVTLDSTLLVEKPEFLGKIVDLSRKQFPEMNSIIMDDEGYALEPGQFVLASTREVFNLPNDIACEFKLKSSAARGGLNHSLAGFADPGWHNSKLTLELQNILQYHILMLVPGMKIGQMVFYRCKEVPEANSYATNGRYNNTMEVTASKGV